MCFGAMEPTKQQATNSTSTVAPPKWVQEAGKSNYGLAQQILDAGFQQYGGTRVAPLSTDEQTAGGIVRNAATGGNPYQTEAEQLLRAPGQAPSFNYGFNTIADEGGPLGSISGYMSPYLQQVLDPMLRELGIMGQQQRNDIGASATMSGAFGDARHGVENVGQMQKQLQATNDVTGKVYNDAWTQAMQNRQADASRQFQTQGAQAGEDRAALERMRASGIDLTNLDKYGVSRDLGLAGALGGFGATERDLAQKQADVDYTNFQSQVGGFDKEMLTWLTQMLAGTPTPKTTTGTGTTTLSEPNNSGWQAAGAAASSLPWGEMAAAALPFL